MDRHVIANMGTELGATATVFPSDEAVRRFCEAQGRDEIGANWSPTPDAEYDRARGDRPGEPGAADRQAVQPRQRGAGGARSPGATIYQAYIGSSANPGYRDFAMAAEMVKAGRVPTGVSFDVNPTSRQIARDLMRDGRAGSSRSHAGARLHQAGCNGCIGMGQAPATGRISLRTVPRNFPGRSGTREDQVYLCSPETAAASALTGVITDPRTLDMAYPQVHDAGRAASSTRRCSVGPLRRERSAGSRSWSRARTSPPCRSSSRCPTRWNCRCC